MADRPAIDVFVSYSSLDRDRVRPIVESLTASGLRVWWDPSIAPGAGFDAEIQNALDNASCVLVIWSKHSVTSEWVITEASDGLERGILVPVSIDDSRPPLAFRRRQTISVGSGNDGLNQVGVAVRSVLEGEAVEYVRSAPRHGRSKALWAVVGLLSGALAGVFGGYLLASDESVQASGPLGTPVRAPFPLPDWEDYQSDASFMPSLAMSRNGRVLVYVARDGDGAPRLRYRSLDRLESEDIEGTEGGEMPFLSPDGHWVGFLVGNELKRVPLVGGIPSTVTTLGKDAWGASWGDDDTIVFSEGRSGLKSVSLSGGPSEHITRLDHERFQGSHRLPDHIAGSRVLLYSVLNGAGPRSRVHEIWALDLDSGETTFLTDGVMPRFVDSGHIVYAKAETNTRGSLWAVPFDLDKIQLTGAPVALQSGVAGREGSAFAVGSRGALVYMPDQGRVSTQIMLQDADGSERPVGAGGLLDFPAISNAGDTVAFGGWNYGGNEDTVRVVRLSSGAVSRIGRGSIPLWGANDRTMTYAVHGEGIVRQRLDGDGSREVLVPHTRNIFPQQWLDNGRTLLFNLVEAGQLTTIVTYTLTVGESPVRILPDGASPEVSSNEQWISFCTWPAGVYVADYPELRARTLVSERGCTPKWGRNDARL